MIEIDRAHYIVEKAERTSENVTPIGIRLCTPEVKKICFALRNSPSGKWACRLKSKEREWGRERERDGKFLYLFLILIFVMQIRFIMLFVIYH